MSRAASHIERGRLNATRAIRAAMANLAGRLNDGARTLNARGQGPRADRLIEQENRSQPNRSRVVRSQDRVDAVLGEAEKAGGTILKPAATLQWGGRGTGGRLPTRMATSGTSAAAPKARTSPTPSSQAPTTHTQSQSTASRRGGWARRPCGRSALDHGAVAHDGVSAWDVLSAVRGVGCELEQFDEVAGGVGEQDLASAGAGHRVASEGQSSGA
jgi:hypothetical protein